MIGRADKAALNVGSLWESVTPKPRRFAPLSHDRRADLAILGGGLLGLSTALHGAKAGLEVALLEAQSIGFGASSRNTGFVVPSLKSALGPQEVTALLGAVHAERLLGLASRSGASVFGLIDAHKIDCAATQAGWLQPGHSRAGEALLRARLDQLQAAGQPSRFVERDEMRALTGLPRLYGGLMVTSGGQINPYAYSCGLAAAAQQLGADLYENSAALSIRREGAHWCVETSAGRLMARQVLLATNALVGALCPPMRASIIPVEIFQVATEPLPASVSKRVLPKLTPLADTRRHTFALRWHDNRLISGGMVPPLPGRRSLAQRTFLQRITRQIPDCPPLKAAFVWRGVIAATLDALPRMIQIDDGLYGAIGCNGRGVALTTALGEPLAAFFAGRIAAADFTLKITPPRPVPLRRFAGLAPHAWLPVSNLRDGLEARYG